MKEVWKDIEEYEGLYQVSNFGRIKSLNYRRTGKAKILKIAKITKGYYGIILHKKGKYKNFKTHRLVAMAFIPNPDDKPQINHIDGDKSNNCISNLEWATNSENQKHAHVNGLIKSSKGSEHYLSRSVVQFSKENEFIAEYDSMSEAAKINIISHSNISACCSGKQKSAGSYKWKYKII